MHTCVYTQAQARVHACIHTQTHTHTHINVHTHDQVGYTEQESKQQASQVLGFETQIAGITAEKQDARTDHGTVSVYVCVCVCMYNICMLCESVQVYRKRARVKARWIEKRERERCR